MKPILTLTLAGLLLSIAGGALAHEGETHFPAGEPGDPKKPARAVIVTMKETDDGKMLFEPSALAVKQGEQVRFILVNAGALKHEFMLSSVEANDKHAKLMQKFPDMEHDEANGKTLEPKARTEMLWKFSKAGTFEFACLIPGHRESGMHGSVAVNKPNK